MKQKIYKDDPKNKKRYNVKKGVKCFVHIANGTMWKAITMLEMPPSPVSPKTYKTYGYPWFKIYDDELVDIEKSKALEGVKSGEQIEKEKKKKEKKKEKKEKVKEEEKEDEEDMFDFLFQSDEEEKN
eukprot:TRINITY_DN8494_c0_g2_i1.p1 TRINITY_DN8494_c0_g2~~TRINITY_DN8494_c0_g2_i1.p1  ORF type:complete len:144 (-),score=68.40 TRINITY_DN8494_c0_g2_i1:78-458(-)